MNCIYIVLYLFQLARILCLTPSAKSGPTTDAALKFTSWLSFVERLVAIVINKPMDKIMTKKRDFSHIKKQLKVESSQQLLN